MPDVSRREWLLYMVAAGTGVGVVAREAQQEGVDTGPVPAVGGPGENETGPTGEAGGSGTVPGSVDLGTAATLAGVSTADVDAAIKLVRGANRDYGVHVTVSGSLPVHAEGEGYEIAVVDALADRRDPKFLPQFVFVVGSNRDYGVHVVSDDASGRLQQADDYELAWADALADMAAPDILPQAQLEHGQDRDYGTHVEVSS